MAYFNAGNVFIQWDLNPIAAATGIPRDTLALDRDAFLQPFYAKYRAAASQYNFKAAADDESLFFDPDFQAFVETGALPPAGYVTPAAPSVTPAPTAAGTAAVASTLPHVINTAAAIGPAGFTLAPSGVRSVVPAAAGGFDLTSLLVLAGLAYGAYYLVTHRKG